MGSGKRGSRRRQLSAEVAPRGSAARARAEVAQVAARLMAEEGVRGFAQAKARAADMLRISGRNALPRNDEIDLELRAYQALFQADTQPRWLAAKRREALAAMSTLAAFEPRLAGSVLRGTAAEDAEITLHLFVEPPELVATFLHERGIPWELDAWYGRFGAGRELELPMYRVHVGDESFRLIVFPLDGRREAPLSSVDGRPMARASAAEVAGLLHGREAPAGGR